MTTFSNAFETIITAALTEDIGQGDVTTRLLVDASLTGTLRFVAREPLVACGAGVIPQVFARLGHVETQDAAADGQRMKASDSLLEISGNAAAMLTGERVAINLLQRMCAVATLTAKYVDAVKGTRAKIYDTRKTMPGLRALDKYAVRAGGGENHRMRLDDGVLIKDNHIALMGGITKAVAKAKQGKLPVEVECDNLNQVEEALMAGADIILLDNMRNDMLQQAVVLVNGKVPLEASGNVSLDTVRGIAETGVDRISVGKITHSAPSVDIGLDVVVNC